MQTNGQKSGVAMAAPSRCTFQSRGVISSLDESGLAELKSELERLSGLGSAWASSALGWLCICKSKDGTRDPVRAIELCRAPAAAPMRAMYLHGPSR